MHSIVRSGKFRSGLVVAAATLLVIGVLLNISPPGGDARPTPIGVAGVSVERLEGVGITLTNPDDGVSRSAISEEEAMAASAALRPGNGKILDAVLVEMTDSSSMPKVNDRLVWVLSFDTSGVSRAGAGPFGSGGEKRTTDWSLAFIDATTGEYLFALEGGEP